MIGLSFVKMFWFLVVLAAAVCAPVTQDPDSATIKHTTNKSKTSNVDDVDLVFILRKLLETNNLSEDLNKRMDYIDMDLIQTFVDQTVDENENYGIMERLEENIQQSEVFSEAAVNSLINIFNYIKTNYEVILKELNDSENGHASFDTVDVTDAAEKREDTDEISVRQRKFPSGGEQMDTLTTETEFDFESMQHVPYLQNGENVLKREEIYDDGNVSKDELITGEMDKGVHQYISHETSYLSLKTFYEKRGGLCTLIIGYRKTPIYVISKCPLRPIAANIKHLCENTPLYTKSLSEENIIDITLTPVQDSEGFVYKNVYCAQCNDVASVLAWSTKLDCDDLQPVEVSDGREKVTFLNQFTDKNIGCQRLIEPPAYSNQLIHECLHTEVINTKGHQIHQTRIGGAGGKSDVSPFPLSFSILMNFGFDGKTHILFSTTADEQMVSMLCGQNEMYDSVNGVCRTITCYDGYVLVDKKCQKDSSINSDTSTEDIDYLSDIDEPVEVVLSINNISFGERYMLMFPSMEELMVLNLADTFDISIDRIQNLTLSFDNTTSGKAIKINKLTTLPQSTISNTNDMKQTTDAETTDAGTTRGTNIFVNHSPTSKQTTFPFIVYTRPQYNEDERVDETDNLETGNATVDILQNQTNTYKVNNIHPTVEPETVHDSDDNGSATKNTISTPANLTTVVDDDIWNEPTNISVRISFILYPAHHNKTLLEKSVKTVVQSMNNLIDTNSFMLTINGTNFQVQGIQDTTSMDLFCQKGFQEYHEQDSFEVLRYLDEGNDINVTAIYVNNTRGPGSLYFPGQFDLTLSVEGVVGNLSQTTVNQFAFVCVMPKINDVKCGRITLTKSEYVLYENKTLRFSNHTYNISEYEYDNEKLDVVRICAPDWITAQPIYNPSQWTLACGDDLSTLVIAESYLTFILGVISLISMLSVLITYGLFDRLRNLPGVNTINLTLSLFLGEFVFIISGWIQPHQAWLCSGVGIVLHYLFLASFFWMNVMSYDVYRTFASKCILRRVRDKKTYVPRYAVYAWGCPLLIVSVCAFLDFSKLFDGVRVGYGGSHSPEYYSDTAGQTSRNYSSSSDKIHVYQIGCWIQEPVASMATFGGPLVVILLSNVVMFTRTIICIRASTKSTRLSVRRSSLSHMTGRDDVILYIRMSTVMGFTWLFGLASPIVSAFVGDPSKTSCIILHLLGILFIVFNCSQGLFIFFAFIFNRRVLGFYRGLIQRMKKRERPMSASSSRGTLTTVASQLSCSQVTLK